MVCKTLSAVILLPGLCKRCARTTQQTFGTQAAHSEAANRTQTMMSTASRRGRNWAIASLVVAVSAGLPGCGGIDGLELNGKLFDAVGLSPDSFKKTEPKTDARAPLVLPPDANRLPEPGAVPQAVPTTLAQDPSWPKDPEALKLADADAKKRAHDEYCKNGNWRDKAVKNETATGVGPNGSCSNSIFSAVTDAIAGNKK